MNIHLDIFWCVFDILYRLFSPLISVLDMVRYSPSWSITSLPFMLIVLLSTSSIVHFFACDDPDTMCTWIVPVMFILLLLKHLNSPIDLSGCFFAVFA